MGKKFILYFYFCVEKNVIENTKPTKLEKNENLFI